PPPTPASISSRYSLFVAFFFNATATTEIYTLSLHDALPIWDTHIRASTALEWATEAPSPHARYIRLRDVARWARFSHAEDARHEDRKSTRLNSSHVAISYAVFCLKKKK